MTKATDVRVTELRKGDMFDLVHEYRFRRAQPDLGLVRVYFNIIGTGGQFVSRGSRAYFPSDTVLRHDAN